MALISCYECGKQISSDAVKCPQCGAANKKVKAAQWLYLVAVVIAVLGAFLMSAIN